MSYGEFALWMTGIILVIFVVAAGAGCLFTHDIYRGLNESIKRYSNSRKQKEDDFWKIKY